jgi:hypothetical protein
MASSCSYEEYPVNDETPDEPPPFSRFQDLRFVIGSLFLIFGVIVTITGLTADEADLAKAGGINVSLWTGLAMLVLSTSFFLWVRLSRPEVPTGHDA